MCHERVLMADNAFVLYYSNYVNELLSSLYNDIV